MLSKPQRVLLSLTESPQNFHCTHQKASSSSELSFRLLQCRFDVGMAVFLQLRLVTEVLQKTTRNPPRRVGLWSYLSQQRELERKGRGVSLSISLNFLFLLWSKMVLPFTAYVRLKTELTCMEKQNMLTIYIFCHFWVAVYSVIYMHPTDERGHFSEPTCQTSTLCGHNWVSCPAKNLYLSGLM